MGLSIACAIKSSKMVTFLYFGWRSRKSFWMLGSPRKNSMPFSDRWLHSLVSILPPSVILLNASLFVCFFFRKEYDVSLESVPRNSFSRLIWSNYKAGELMAKHKFWVRLGCQVNITDQLMFLGSGVRSLFHIEMLFFLCKSIRFLPMCSSWEWGIFPWIAASVLLEPENVATLSHCFFSLGCNWCIWRKWSLE